MERRVVPTGRFWAGLALMVLTALMASFLADGLVGDRRDEITDLARRGQQVEGTVVRAVPAWYDRSRVAARVAFPVGERTFVATRSFRPEEGAPRIGDQLPVRYLPEDPRIAFPGPLGAEIARREAVMGRARRLDLLIPLLAAALWGSGFWRDRRWLRKGTPEPGRVLNVEAEDRPVVRVADAGGAEHQVRLRSGESGGFVPGQPVTLLSLGGRRRVAESIMWARESA